MGRIIPYSMENKKWLKPPTSHFFFREQYDHHLKPYLPCYEHFCNHINGQIFGGIQLGLQRWAGCGCEPMVGQQVACRLVLSALVWVKATGMSHVSTEMMAHPTARKWVITPVINGISKVNPLITGVITHLLSGMSHQAEMVEPQLKNQ